MGNKTLKEYITKGFVLNDDMLKMVSCLEKIILQLPERQRQN